jgi:hypothetical protein
MTVHTQATVFVCRPQLTVYDSYKENRHSSQCVLGSVERPHCPLMLCILLPFQDARVGAGRLVHEEWLSW